MCVRSHTVLSKLLKALRFQLQQEETLKQFSCQNVFLSEYFLYSLCKAKIFEVTVLDASAHTVPTYNATPLTVKSSIKSSSLCQASLEHLKACCFFPDKKGMKHDIHLQSDFALTLSKPKRHYYAPF